MTAAEGRALARTLGEQSTWYDPATKMLSVPEAELWLSVIELALVEIPDLELPRPRAEEFADGAEEERKKMFAGAMTLWLNKQREAEDALNFLETDRVDPIFDILGIDREWAHSVISMWIK